MWGLPSTEKLGLIQHLSGERGKGAKSFYRKPPFGFGFRCDLKSHSQDSHTHLSFFSFFSLWFCKYLYTIVLLYPIHGMSSWRMMLGALNCKTEELLLSVMITRVLQTHDNFCSQKFSIHFCVPEIFRHFISCPSDSKIYSFDDFRAERKCALSVLISCH